MPHMALEELNEVNIIYKVAFMNMHSTSPFDSP